LALPFFVDTLEEISDASFREAYVEDESGKWTLDLEKYEAIKVTPIKKNLEKAIGEKKKFQSAVEKYKHLTDEDLSKLEDLKAAGDLGADAGKIPEDVRQKWVNDRKAERAQWEQQTHEKVSAVESKLSEALKTLERERTARQLDEFASKSGVLPDRKSDLLRLVGDRFKNEDDDLIFYDRDGKPSDLTPDRAFSLKLREEHPWAFAADQIGGSGGGPANKGPQPRVIKLSRADAKDARKYRDAAERAKTAGVELVISET
jgi:hypothetical protein